MRFRRRSLRRKNRECEPHQWRSDRAWHPLGMSGARLVMTATEELMRSRTERVLCTMCIGADQGMAMAFERLESCKGRSAFIADRLCLECQFAFMPSNACI